jgi:hypothetical protein
MQISGGNIQINTDALGFENQTNEMKPEAELENEEKIISPMEKKKNKW